MIGMVDIEFIKKKHFQEGWSIRHLAKVLAINRIMVRKVLAATEIPRYRLSVEKPAPIMGPMKGLIEQWLKEDANRPRKQRHTARRIYRRLVEEHQFPGSESSVRKCVQKLRGEGAEVFIPLEAEAGKMGQVDWGTADVLIAGVETTLHLFVLRLRHSGVAFARAYRNEVMECFLDGHREAFEWLGGIPRTLVYDNLKSAVTRVLTGPDREESTQMSALRAHYLFDSAFCRPGKGNEKGSVENGVGYIRRNALVPLPEVRTLEELNSQLLDWCRRDKEGRKNWTEESQALSPLPNVPFPCCRTRLLKVSPQLLISEGTNRYSVPWGYQGKKVVCHVFPERVEIADRDHVIASHARLEGKHGLQIDIRHYLPVLERKPRAITGMASFRTLPAVFIRVRDHLVSSLRREGWKEMVAILLLLQTYPMKSVETALAKSEAAGSIRADTVRQFLLLESAPPVPLPALLPDRLQDIVVPLNTPDHFDALLSVGGLR